jgi:hypothetical protein
MVDIKQVDNKTWRAGYLEFRDLGKIEKGVTHKYEVCPDGGGVLGWVEWKAGWRRYTFRPVTGYEAWFDALCLTTVADFIKLRTDERKAQMKLKMALLQANLKQWKRADARRKRGIPCTKATASKKSTQR